MERYPVAEKAILDLSNITKEEKDERIKALQEEFIGKDAEAFRREKLYIKGAEK